MQESHHPSELTNISSVLSKDGVKSLPFYVGMCSLLDINVYEELLCTHLSIWPRCALCKISGFASCSSWSIKSLLICCRDCGRTGRVMGITSSRNDFPRPTSMLNTHLQIAEYTITSSQRLQSHWEATLQRYMVRNTCWYKTSRFSVKSVQWRVRYSSTHYCSSLSLRLQWGLHRRGVCTLLPDASFRCR